jgi:hypothetical protein
MRTAAGEQRAQQQGWQNPEAQSEHTAWLRANRRSVKATGVPPPAGCILSSWLPAANQGPADFQPAGAGTGVGSVLQWAASAAEVALHPTQHLFGRFSCLALIHPPAVPVRADEPVVVVTEIGCVTSVNLTC